MMTALRRLLLLLSVVCDEFGYYASAHVVASTQWLVVDLVRVDWYRKMVLIQRCRSGMEKPIDMSDRPVWAGTLLKVDAWRVGQRC